MNQELREKLLSQATVIRTERGKFKNTAERVGRMLTDIINAIGDDSDNDMFEKVTLSDDKWYIRAKADLVGVGEITAYGTDEESGEPGEGDDQPGYARRLSELADVSVVNPANGQALVWDSSALNGNGAWVAKSIAAGLDLSALSQYLQENKYATQDWVKGQGFLANLDLSHLLSKEDAKKTYLPRVEFDELFEKVTLDNGSWYIKAKANFVGVGEITAYGADGETGEPGVGVIQSLGGLTDVSLTASLVAGQALVWDGKAWINRSIASGLDESALAKYLQDHGFLTKHQAIYGLTFAAGAFEAKAYNPAAGAVTVNIPASTDHVAEGASRLYFTDARAVAALAPTVNSLNTAISKKLDKATFDEMFEKVTVNGSWYIRAKANFVGVGEITAYGADSDNAGGTGAGTLDVASLAAYLSQNNYLTRPVADGLYLQLTGGTLNFGTKNANFNLNNTNGTEIGMRLNMSGASKGWMGYHTTYGTNLYNYAANAYLGLRDNGKAYVNDNQLAFASDIPSLNNYLHFGLDDKYVAARFLYRQELANKAAEKYIEFWQSGAGWFNFMAGKYIVAGGTASQFLKGDGSLDSTTYAKMIYAGENINNLDGFGFAYQAANANALTSGGYPIQEAGALIYCTAAYGKANQIYGTYGTNRWFARGGGNTSKTSWREFAFIDSVYSKTEADSRYVNTAGDTMTGVLRVNNICATNSYGLLAYKPTDWTGVSSSQWGVGSGDVQGVIRSNNTNLIHYRGGLNATIWDSVNDGPGSGLNADLLDGYHLGRTEGSIISWGSLGYYNSDNNGDTDDTPNYKNFLKRIVGTSPYGSKLGGYAFLGTLTPNSQRLIIGRAYNDTDIVNNYPRYSYFLSVAYGGRIVTFGTSEGNYYEYYYARTIDNVASATKLQTARTLWGQSFDGTASVSGDLIGVQDIRMSRYLFLKHASATKGYYLNAGSDGSMSICQHNNYTWTKSVMAFTADGKVRVGTDTASYAINAASFICDSWIRTKGNTGWYNESYGGGWYMTDSSYIKNYNKKRLKIEGIGDYFGIWLEGSGVCCEGYGGSSWNNGHAALNVGIVKNDAQTPLLMAYRNGAAAHTGSNRLFALELLNSGSDLHFAFGGANKFTMTSAGNFLAVGEVTAYSDRRLKSDIKPLYVKGRLRPVRYQKDGRYQVGLIAQEVRELCPEAVMETNTPERYLALCHNAAYAAALSGVYGELDDHERRLKKLESRLTH